MGSQALFQPSLRSPMTSTSSLIRLLRSGSVRIALSYALVFIVSTLLLVGYLWWQTTNYSSARPTQSSSPTPAPSATGCAISACRARWTPSMTG